MAGQALRGQALDPLALLGAARRAAVLHRDAAVQVMPEQTHLHIQPRPGDRHSSNFLERLWSRIHASSPPDGAAT